MRGLVARLSLTRATERRSEGVVDAWFLEDRCGFRPSISLEEMIGEAFEAAG